MVDLMKFNSASLLPYTIGFDRLFERLENSPHGSTVQPFPHYDIIRDLKDENKYLINIALAGYTQKDIDIEVKDSVLTVKTVFEQEVDNSKSDNYVYHGISRRNFTRRFTLADDVVVSSANMENGLLSISLERIIPEAKKPRKIAITSEKQLLVEG